MTDQKCTKGKPERFPSSMLSNLEASAFCIARSMSFWTSAMHERRFTMHRDKVFEPAPILLTSVSNLLTASSIRLWYSLCCLVPLNNRWLKRRRSRNMSTLRASFAILSCFFQELEIQENQMSTSIDANICTIFHIEIKNCHTYEIYNVYIVLN